MLASSQAAQRQLRNVPHVAVVKYASHFQHGLDALQVYVARGRAAQEFLERTFGVEVPLDD